MDEFQEGRPKSVVVPQNIDAVRELILQDRHVTCEIKVFLGISMMSIYKLQIVGRVRGGLAIGRPRAAVSAVIACGISALSAPTSACGAARPTDSDFMLLAAEDFPVDFRVSNQKEK
ncbi:hypothetical protein EVAR_87000_1 [Eumeta japonica]|uniref:Uncharacterized protein n=1 Tax=Eumeta variegata TaxID=151549 RepID=A0A4C1W9E5_EUMVA|nr:hypothetical protein EVAR_87000_1 [Eumeta japonica]